MILVITNNYPSVTNLYANFFVHKRVLSYLNRGEKVSVYCPGIIDNIYTYENVDVYNCTAKCLVENIDVNDIKVIFIHFLTYEIYEQIKSINEFVLIPKFVWIHGFECESWFRRHFIFNNDIESYLSLIHNKINYNDKNLEVFRFLFSGGDKTYRFVNISKWFKENVVESDIGFITPTDIVIPNPIDNTLFNFVEKSPSQRYNVLLIRPFTTTKYANDIAIDAIKILSKDDIFSKFKFTICGDGPLFNKLTKEISLYENVTIRKGFLSQNEISHLHKTHGTFLIPTRWDSQGVSMCEAMASGLVVLSSNVSAIPEFVENGVTGFLFENNPRDFVEGLKLLSADPDLFNTISLNASKSIEQKCNMNLVAFSELNLIGLNINPIYSRELSLSILKNKIIELENLFLQNISFTQKNEYIKKIILHKFISFSKKYLNF